MSQSVSSARSRVVVIGGGPGGYEAALVAAQLGADVTVVESEGLGGAAVLTDVVPSKTLIATAEVMTQVREAGELGVRFAAGEPALHLSTGTAAAPSVDLGAVNDRVRRLARAQSDDVLRRVEAEGVRVVPGRGVLDGAGRVGVTGAGGTRSTFPADQVLIAVGARPRTLAEAMPDGERILTWTQLYHLDALPERLVVVGSGVTGAEFASAYHALGTEVVLVSSRDRVLPGEDADAAQVLEKAFAERGLEVVGRSRAKSATRTADGVLVTLADGRILEGSHVLMAVGSVPNTEHLGLAEAGVATTESGHITVDRVSRTAVRDVYAAGDCTGVLALASVAAAQGRTAMYHALGDAVRPLDLRTVSSNIFTAPEIATVGVSEAQVTSGEVPAHTYKLELAGNPRAKMQGVRDGFVKLFCAHRSQEVLGAVVVAPRACELIFPVAMAVANRITVDELAHSSTVFPSMTGSIAEAARRLHKAL